jgi:hypothetical protein
LLSSPVSSFTIAGSVFEPGTTDDLYRWNEPEDQWYNYKSGDPSQIEPGKGYLVAYSADATKSFTGSLNAADVSVTGLTNTSGVSLHKGWNLLGNPFSSALNWAGTGWTKTNVGGACQIWKETDASYTVISDGNNIIPAMNGFMVYTTGSGTVVIPKASRVHHTQPWYKNGQQDNGSIMLVAHDQEGQTAQESVIRFNTDATEGYDNEYDSYFLAGYAPMFYSVAGNDAYALNTLPEKTNDLTIPFSFIKNGSTSFNIELAKNLPETILYLEDKKTATIQNLTENPVYNFAAAEGDNANRFVLHFATLVGLDKPGTVNQVHIFSFAKDVYINANQTSTGSCEVFIYNAIGQVVYHSRFVPAVGNQKFTTLYAPGAYVVKVISHTGTTTTRIIVH